jgi:2-C-methyl-D-erythritol 2,4-cyclodiphosphate synthase
MDAILGALALGDIGQWFPDTDPAFAGADSIDLLRTIVSHDAVRPWTLVNADCVVMAQRPRLMAHVPAMRSRLAEALRSSADRVAIKATTTERLGFVGREEGMAAQAVVLLAADAAGG